MSCHGIIQYLVRLRCVCWRRRRHAQGRGRYMSWRRCVLDGDGRQDLYSHHTKATSVRRPITRTGCHAVWFSPTRHRQWDSTEVLCTYVPGRPGPHDLWDSVSGRRTVSKSYTPSKTCYATTRSGTSRQPPLCFQGPRSTHPRSMMASTEANPHWWCPAMTRGTAAPAD